jgi:hypothetical protein
MRTALAFTFVGIILVLILWFGLPVIVGPKSIDIHLHDTKIIIAGHQLLGKLLIVLILLFASLFTLGGIIGTRFRKKGFIIAFALFFILDFGCVVYITRLLK